MGSPSGAPNKAGMGKTSHFQGLNVNISKMVGDTAKVTINHVYEVVYALSTDTEIAGFRRFGRQQLTNDPCCQRQRIVAH